MINIIRVIVIAGLLALCQSAKAGLDLPDKEPLFVRGGYDYAPSVIVDNNLMKIWWCGYGTFPGSTTGGDVIYYRTYNTSTGQFSAITKVMWPTPGAWDGVHTCDPSVVEGTFSIPGSSSIYNYAMYYTATDRADGRNSRIGVAFSVNGVSWVKVASPVIYPQAYPATGTYGAGQAGTYNQDGVDNILLMYVDTSPQVGTRIYTRSTIDGINFGPPTTIPNGNNGGLAINITSGDIAYESAEDVFYRVVSGYPVRSGDTESYQMGLFKMSAANFLSGSGAWELQAVLNSANTGFRELHNPSFLRDGYGNLDFLSPDITMFFGAGDVDPSTWEIASATWSPVPNSMPLKRYFSATGCLGQMPEHWITTGYVRHYCGFNFESVVGYLKMAPVTGTAPLFGCVNGQDHVLARGSCGVTTPLGIEGWIYTSPATGRAALYRCTTGSGLSLNHFVSRSPTCEGRTVEGILGYISTSP